MHKKLLVIGLAAALTAGVANAELKAFKVNGDTVSVAEQKAIYDRAVAQGQKPDANLELMVKQVAIRNAVVLQAAEKADIDSKPEVKAAIKEATDAIISRAFMNDWASKNPVSEGDIQSAYNTQKHHYGDTEYEVRHILVKTEDQAKNLIRRLKKGSDFGKLASEFSEDKQSGVQGGKLGWIVPHAYHPVFGASFSALKPGAVAENPVETPYGFHVVKLEGKRPAKLFPTYEEAHDQIKFNLTNQKVMKHVADLVKQAKIK